MNIDNLSPLQRWLERINDYIAQDNTLKARFASLLLPVFEAWELLSVLKKICFKSSREPSESFSKLAAKAHVLALNILFAGFEGFKDPLFNYQYHQACGLTSSNEEEPADKIAPDRPDNKKLTSISAARISSPTSLTNSPVQKLKTLRAAPHIKEKESSFIKGTDEILTRHQLLSTRRAATPPPEAGKNKVRFQDDEKKEEKKSDEIGTWESLRFLVEKPLERNGSWVQKKGHFEFKPTRRSSIDPVILPKLAEAVESGFLKTLNFDELLNLHLNIRIINKCLRTIKGSHFENMIKITNRLQPLLIAQWVETDYQEDLFYQYCLKLIESITSSLTSKTAESPKGRLFESPSTHSLAIIFEEWHWQAQPSKKKESKFKFTQYDHYEILKAYFQNLPTDIKGKWLHLKQARSAEDWHQALKKLSSPDDRLFKEFIQLLKVGHQTDWPGQLDQMLTALTPLLTPICSDPAFLKSDLK